MRCPVLLRHPVHAHNSSSQSREVLNKLFNSEKTNDFTNPVTLISKPSVYYTKTLRVRSIRFFNLSMSVCDEKLFVRIDIYHSEECDSLDIKRCLSCIHLDHG